jgi:Predicted hydrolases of the HAD superfamily
MTIAVDFDGTIVEHEYPKIGEPVPFAIEVLKKLKNEGHTLILWTVRSGSLLKDAISYCESNGLTFYAANQNYPDEKPGECSRKLSVDLFIDDRNLGGIPDWGIIYQVIKSGTNNIADMDYTMDDTRKKRKKNFFIRLGEAWDRASGKGY